jgi:hypothetical protein
MKIPDPATDPRHERVRKLPVATDVRFATSHGTVETLEGRVPYRKGDAILTGAQGEDWPVERDRFLRRYEAVEGTGHGEGGRYARATDVMWAIRLEPADMPVAVEVPGGGRLDAKPGDWLVLYEEDDIGVVDPIVFEKTYEILDQGD